MVEAYMKAGIEEDFGWGNSTLILVTNAAKCGEGVQVKKRPGVKKKPSQNLNAHSKMKQTSSE